MLQMMLGGKSPAEAVIDFFPPETQAQLRALCIAISETRAAVARIEAAQLELSVKLNRVADYVVREIALAECATNGVSLRNRTDAG